MKRSVWSFVVLLLVLLPVLGCTTSNENNGSSSESATETVKPEGTATAEDTRGDLPLSQETAEIRVMANDNWYAPKSYATNLPVWQEIEQKTNVKVTWEVTPAAQFTDVVSTTFAAATDLPDFIFGYFPYASYAESGLILDLKPLIEQHAPHIQKLLDDNPRLKAMITSPDGHIYNLPIVMNNSDLFSSYLIRQDWLDKVGKQVPTTMDELYDVLVAFRDGDPNGNNKKDEIPFALDSWWTLTQAASAYARATNDFFPNQDGKIEYQYLTDGWKQYLTFWSKAYEEKLLDQGFASISYDKYMSMINTDLIGVTYGGLYSINTFNGTMPDARWTAFFPKGPDGKYIIESFPPTSGVGVITKDAKDPVLVIKWLDYIMASEDGIRFNNFGVENTSYTMADGKPQYNDFVMNNPEQLSPKLALASIGAVWGFTSVRTEEILQITLTPEVKPVYEEGKQYLAQDTYFSNTAPMTSEEAAIYSSFSDLWTYGTESMTKFIMGNMDINEDWESYVEKAGGFGLEKILANEQVKYDRIQAMMNGTN